MLNANVPMVCMSCVPYPRSTSLNVHLQRHSRLFWKLVWRVGQPMKGENVDALAVKSVKCIFLIVVSFQVRQYIHAVNGENVLRMDHKQVAKMIVGAEQFLNLSVMVHKRDALFTDCL